MGWTALPEPALRYRFHDRWSDVRAGHADAKAGIPAVTVTGDLASSVPNPGLSFFGHPDATQPFPEQQDVEPADAAPATVPLTDPEPRAADFERIVPSSEPPASPPAAFRSLTTPYLVHLRNVRNLYLAAALEQYRATRGEFRKQLSAAQHRRENAAAILELATARHAELDRELTPDELDRRGLAELDEQKWPNHRVHERRKRTHQLARHQAAEHLREATVELRTAELAVEHAQAALHDRFKLVQAVGWQIVHHFGRREATYLRTLARVHKHGPALVELLELVGPDLPDWLLKTDAEKEET